MTDNDKQLRIINEQNSVDKSINKKISSKNDIPNNDLVQTVEEGDNANISDTSKKEEEKMDSHNVKNDFIEKNNFFGYDNFFKSEGLFENSFEDALDPNYLLGPGDEVIIMLWGQTELNQSYLVSKKDICL